LPKLMSGFLHLTMAFLEVQRMGKEIGPVSERMVNSEVISSLSCGRNLNLISVVMPGEIFPLGVYEISK
jgi:hypothetical protein